MLRSLLFSANKSYLSSRLIGAGVSRIAQTFSFSYSCSNEPSCASSRPTPGSKISLNDFDRYNAALPVDEASFPPSSWYTDAKMLQLEKEKVFKKNWIAVGRTDQLKNPGDYFTGSLLGEPFIVVRAPETGSGKPEYRAYFNACKHHGTRVAEKDGNVSEFVCPYHGWVYDTDTGRLKKATRLKGIKDFKASRIGLTQLAVQSCGPFVFLNMQTEPELGFGDAMGGLPGYVDNLQLDNLRFLKQIAYKINCNWKVYIDNYLDGGYHVPFAHKALSDSLDLNTYTSKTYDRFSVQHVRCNNNNNGLDAPGRVTGEATYLFLYPNFVLNRYGPWLDTNLVWPLSSTECIVYFDYYLDQSQWEASDFINKSLQSSDRVQQEDIYLCESVQGGLNSSAYDTGRYVPQVEHLMYHFHQILHRDLAHEA